MEKNKLIEGIDYYFETVGEIKYKVFTEKYHKNRGFCCNNFCRHCPYKNKKTKNE